MKTRARRGFTRQGGMPRVFWAVVALLAILSGAGRSALALEGGPMADLSFFAGLEDRYTGTPGAEAAADYIADVFRKAGFQRVGFQMFLLPVPVVEGASLEVEGRSWPVYPWGPNLVYLPVTPDEGLSGPLVYLAEGSFEQMNGKDVEGAIVLMEMSSRNNWLNAQMAGARALIYLGGDQDSRGSFEAKNTMACLLYTSPSPRDS